MNRARAVAALGALVMVGTALAGCSGSSSSAPGTSAGTLAPVASPGCEADIAVSRQSTQRFAAGGTRGDYIQDWPGGGPLPVVIDLHGYLEAASLERQGSGLARFGRSHRFMTITPEITESGNPRWDYSPHSPDIAWLSSLLTHVEHTTCVDERRVYVAGLSMGAFTTSAIACELSNRVAAVAPVAGVQAYSWCDPSRPVPVVAFHGTADPFVAYTGGPGPAALLLPSTDRPGISVGEELKRHPQAKGNPALQSIPLQVATWAKRNGCGATPTQTKVATDVTRFVYPCDPSATVEFYRITGGGHTWPGGPAGVYPASVVGKTTQSISADAIMWQFFRTHPLPGTINN